MGKYRMYEPYGYQDDTNYISKKDQIERELSINRMNDCREFASVEYNETLQAFVFKNVKGQERGYAYMSDIVPQELIADAYYDTDTKTLVITFVNGKVVNIPLNDLIDVVEAGDGLKNVDGKFYINLAEDCERFLTVDENGLLLSGVQDAINVERDRAISAETEEFNRATQAEADLSAAIRQEVSDRTDGDRLIRTIIGTGFSTNETETVSYQFNALSEKAQKEIDDRTTAVAQEAQLREIGDGALDGRITSLDTAKANKSDVYTKSEVYTKEECDERFSGGSSGGTVVDAYTKAESDARFQPIGDYLTQNDLNGYATESWVNNQGFLTEHQSLSGYATEQWVEEQGYLTEHQSLSGYATTEEVEAALALKADTEVTYTKEDVNALLLEKENEIYSLTKIVGDLGGAVTYDLPNAAGKSFNTLMNNNGTVKLTDDVETGRFGPGIMAKNSVKLNLNTHNLTVTGLTDSSAQGAIMSRGTQEITIYGKGTIDAGAGICIEANGADSVINLTGSTTVYQTNRPNAELIYCYSGTINIVNGTFKNNGSPYLLNCYDANYRSGTAKIIVTGGKFYDFNPADNSAEGEHTNFVAEGYHVETSTVTEEGVEHTVYTVKKDA